MGKNETVGGVVRGSESATAVAEAPVMATPKRPGSGWIPPWEAHSADAFDVKWSQRTYQFDLVNGAPIVAQQEWDVKGKGMALPKAGSLIVDNRFPVMTHADLSKVIAYCRETGTSMRRAYAKLFPKNLNGEQRAEIAVCQDVYVSDAPATGTKVSQVSDSDVDAFFASVK